MGIELWMESGSHGGRAAAAFAAIGLIIVTLGINISANSISAANDLMAFCPKYINIRRGQLIAAVIGSWAFVPWKIMGSAAKFLAFLGGYTIFLGPMTSILMCDYFIVRRGNVSVPDMYNFHGMYRYSPKYATNWRAVVAFFIGCSATPGLCEQHRRRRFGHDRCLHRRSTLVRHRIRVFFLRGRDILLGIQPILSTYRVDYGSS